MERPSPWCRRRHGEKPVNGIIAVGSYRPSLFKAGLPDFTGRRRRTKKKRANFQLESAINLPAILQFFFEVWFESLESLPLLLAISHTRLQKSSSHFFQPLKITTTSPNLNLSLRSAAMALRKVLDKLGMKSESRNAGSAELDMASNSSGRSHEGGGGEAKKKMKKVRSIRVAPKKPVLFQPALKETEPPPNFMKSTTSYATRKETTQVTIISSTSTAKTKNTKAYTGVKAPLKSAEKSVPLNQGSRAAMPSSESPKSVEEDKHDCTYPYCSLHGHKHGAVPSLKRFLSTKMQNSMKQRGYSSVEKRGGKEIEIVEDVVNELFIEIQTKLQGQGIQIEDVNNSFEDCGDQNSELSMEEMTVINQFLEYIDKEYQEEEEEVQIKPGVSEQMEANSHKFTSENNFKESRTDFSFNMSKVKRSRSRRQTTKNRESVNEFKPRPPRLLEPQPEPEKEQVNLRHQAANERKAAEEWMVDFALKKTLGRLTSVRRTKVPALVAAFETVVLPQKV